MKFWWSIFFIALYYSSLCSSIAINPKVAHLSVQPTLSNNQTESASTIRFLQSELTSVGAAQQKILNFLASKNIHIGSSHPPVKSLKPANLNDIRSRVAMSTEDNNIECRVSLTRAPIGSKCVAPCGCTGSQKWIQFSEYNKLRRNDPANWVMCPTCQQKFLIDEFTAYGGVQSNIIGFILDKFSIARVIIFVSLFVLGSFLKVGQLFLRFVTSRIFWESWPRWYGLVHLPFPMNLVLLQYSMLFIVPKYLEFEKSTLKRFLIDLESRLIEESLPLNDNEEIIDEENVNEEEKSSK